MTSHLNLTRNKKGIGTVFGMVFFILIVVIVFASFIIVLTQNTGLEQTTIQAKQIDLDRYTELETVSITNPETAVLNNVVYLSCSITNNGTLPTELTRLWIKDITTGAICNVALTPSIVLQPPSNIYYFKSATVAGSSGSDQFAFWFITTRGNSISAYPNINQFNGIVPSGTFPGVTNTNSTYTNNQTLQLSLTTTQPNQLIYVVVSYDDGNTLSSPTSNPILTWTLRGQSSHTDVYGGDSILKSFYAIMPSNGPITINIQSSADELQDYYCSALAFAISGVNTTSPFDGSAQVSIGQSTMPQDTINTYFSNDLVIGALGIDDLNPSINPGPGFGQIMPVQSSYGASGQDNAMPRSVWSEWSIITVPTTNLPVNCTFTSTKVWAVIVDAVKLIVTPPAAPVSLSPTSGLIGQQVTVSGQGFAANSNLMASFDGNQIPINCTTDSSGNIPPGAIFTIPRGSTPGNKTIIIMDGKFNYATANFTINAPSITVSFQTGPVGSPVTVNSVSGAYFMPNSLLTVTYDGAIVANYTSTSLGAVPAGVTFNVPASTYGIHTVMVTDGFGNFAAATFTVTASINLNPTNGPNGTQLTVTGYGFASYSTVTLNFNGAAVGLTSPPLVQTDSSGSFSCWFSLPISTAGSKTVQAIDNSSHTASNTFTVTTPSILLSPTSGSVGSSVTVSGSNFIPNFLITITYNSTAQLTVPTTVTASSTGSFSASFIVRTSSYGNYSVSATDGINIGSANFTVTPSITLSPSNGSVGSTVTVSGTGFTASKTVTATFAGSAVTLGGTTTTDVNGSFLGATFTVPAQTAGAKTVVVTDASSRAGSASFSVTPAIVLNATTGNVGSTVAVSGTGYAGSSTITIKYDGTTQTTSPSTVTSLSSGAFSCTFVIPGSSASSHTVSASDASSNTATAQFAVNQVIQPITVTLTNSAPSATVTLNGFNPSPTTFPADGNSYSITMAAGSTFNLSFTNAGSTRDGFAVSGSFSPTSSSFAASSTPISVTAYEQVQNTYSATFNGGNPPSGDTLVFAGTSVGTASTILTLNVGGVSSASNTGWSDYNTGVTFSATTTMSSSTQRWAINGAYSTASLISGGNTYSQTYINQYLYTLSYMVSGGGSPSSPILASTQFGTAITPTFTGSATGYWLDNGASWNVSPNPLGGSSSTERWLTSQTVSGTVSATQTIIFTYYHQYQVTFSAAGLNSDAGGVTVLAVSSTNYVWNALPSNLWVNSTTSYVWANPVSVNANDQFNLTAGSSGTVTSSAPISATYQEQFKVTFQQSGLDSSATGTVVTVNGAAQTYNNLPYATNWISSGSTVTYSYTNLVTSSAGGKQFRIGSVTGSASPITVNSATTITGNYVAQWQLTFQQNGLGSDATGTVLTIGSNSYTYSQVPQSNIWIDDGTTYTYTGTVVASSGKQYVSTGATGVTSPIHTFGTVTGNYKTQYKVTFSQTGMDSSAAANTVLAIGASNYAYNALPTNAWVDSGAVFSWTSPVSGGTGKQFVQTGSSGSSPITASGTYSATYKTQYIVTFAQSGLSSDATGTVATVAGAAKTYNNLPFTVWIDASTGSVTYSFTATVTSSVTGKQYVKTSTDVSPVTGLSNPLTVTGTYKTQWQVTFTQSGIDSSAGSNTVLTVASTNYAYNALPTSVYVDSGTTFSWTSPVSSGTGKQFAITGSSGSSPITASGTFSATYKTQYQVTFAVSPIGSGTTSPSGTSVWEDAGSLSISSIANNGYHFSSWSATTGITINSPTLATIGASGTITANFNLNLVLDASNGGSATSGTSFTVALTTTNTNDLLYLSIISRSSYVTGVTSSRDGLTWTCREASGSTISLTQGTTRYASTWYAIQTTSGATTINITLSGSTTGASVVVFAVSGANKSSPFDGSPATYATDSSAGTSATVTKATNTANANDFIIGSVALRTTTPTLTLGSGYSLIQTATQTGSYPNEVSAEFKIVSQTGSQTAGYTWSGSDDWAMIIDAITQAS